MPSAGQLILHQDMMNDRLAKNLDYYMFFILSSLRKKKYCLFDKVQKYYLDPAGYYDTVNKSYNLVKQDRNHKNWLKS